MPIFKTGSKLISSLGIAAAASFSFCALLFAPSITQTAIANGDTRTISLFHAHTNETITATFRVNGQYDSAVLEKLNWFLRDWRLDQPTKMDPRLFDLVWETYRESGSREPIKVMSAYRSPQTNAMLRRRSRAVAEFSQHILGKAMDQHYTDVPMSRIREIGMRLQRGGVGYYPTAGSPFVHLDVGSVRHWPKMSYDQLARIFPDGRTVHIPSNGQPLPGYEQARAQIEASGTAEVPVSSIGKTPSFFAALFGGGGEDDAANTIVTTRRGKKIILASAGNIGSQGANVAVETATSSNFFLQEARRTASPAADVAQANNARLSRRGKPAPETAAPAVQVASAAPEPVPAPPPLPAAKPQVLAEAPALQIRPEAPAADPRIARSGETAPLPPRRPSAAILAALAGIDVPLPPPRPSEFGAQTVALKPDAIGKLVVASNRDAGVTPGQAVLPDVILHGPNDAAPKPVPAPALGYAATNEPAPAARPVISARPAVAAALIKVATVKPVLTAPKVDRTGLRSLTTAQPADKEQQQTLMGAAAPPLRSGGGQRAQTAALFADPLPGATTRFEVAASALPTDRFLPQ